VASVLTELTRRAAARDEESPMSFLCSAIFVSTGFSVRRGRVQKRTLEGRTQGDRGGMETSS
jgi:hypothetical protein